MLLFCIESAQSFEHCEHGARVICLVTLVTGQRRRAQLRPTAALALPPSPGPRTGAFGVVRAATVVEGPLDQQLCAGFAVTFWHRTTFRRHGVTLRDGATIGFEVLLDSGEVVRIPPGPLRLAVRFDSGPLAGPLRADADLDVTRD